MTFSAQQGLKGHIANSMQPTCLLPAAAGLEFGMASEAGEMIIHSKEGHLIPIQVRLTRNSCQVGRSGRDSLMIRAWINMLRVSMGELLAICSPQFYLEQAVSDATCIHSISSISFCIKWPEWKCNRNPCSPGWIGSQ